MAVGGRKPKPAALRVIQGNPGKRPIPEGLKAAPSAPRCPTWLAPEARREWRRVVPALDRLGILATVDRAALAAYCEAWARFREASEDIKTRGLVLAVERPRYSRSGELLCVDIVHTPNPAAGIARDAANQLRSLCGEFGMTPSARMRIETPGGDDDGADLFD